MELSLPAGNIECAIEAFNGGADSVYLGLKEFSARKTAENFSFDDIRRLKEYTEEHNKKFYITLNTIASENELDSVFKALKKIEYVSPNGIIVQDLGVVNIIKKHFGSLELHASTQMAVRNTDDLKVLKALGFKRAVLARELSIDEIKRIREQERDMEFKVFIHGALCYSLSGRCYACERITGKRSANRGDCIGVCRWKWENEKGEKAHYFSLSDLISDFEIINELKNAGVDALKVEGRLKNETYTYESARYYRFLIDNARNNEELKQKTTVAFARKTSNGYFYKDSKDFSKNLECSDYVGHRGYKCGVFINKSDVMLTSDIEKHDGLMFIDRFGNDYKFTLKDNKTHHASNEILKNICNNSYRGNVLYKIKSASGALKKFNKNSIEPYIKKVNENFIITDDCIQIGETKLSFSIQKANSKQNLKKNILNVFKTKEGMLSVENITLYNRCHISDINDIYIPLSILKSLKKEYYKTENKKIERRFEEPFIKSTAPQIKNRNERVNTDGYKIVNYLGDLKGYIEKTEKRNAVISPFMNSANSECVSLFKEICAPYDCTVKSICEKSMEKNIPNCIERTQSYDTPIFISYAPFPDEGIYKTEILGKQVRVKVEHKGDIAYTYLL